MNVGLEPAYYGVRWSPSGTLDQPMQGDGIGLNYPGVLNKADDANIQPTGLPLGSHALVWCSAWLAPAPDFNVLNDAPMWAVRWTLLHNGAAVSGFSNQLPGGEAFGSFLPTLLTVPDGLLPVFVNRSGTGQIDGETSVPLLLDGGDTLVFVPRLDTSTGLGGLRHVQLRLRVQGWIWEGDAAGCC